MFGSDLVATMPLEGTNGRRLKVWMECNVGTQDPAQQQTGFHEFIDFSIKLVARRPIFTYDVVLSPVKPIGRPYKI